MTPHFNPQPKTVLSIASVSVLLLAVSGVGFVLWQGSAAVVMALAALAPFALAGARLALRGQGVTDSLHPIARLHSPLPEEQQAHFQMVLALGNAIDAKDSYTANGHSRPLALMAVNVGRALGLRGQELMELRYGALLHDVGKIGVPDAILHKPSHLSEDEWRLMRQHPAIGARILEPVPALAPAARIVRHHHERYDGHGYPDGLQGDDIPLGARILAVVDAYSAITDDRVYRRARSHDEAVQELLGNAGTQFDPLIVETFLALAGQRRGRAA